MKIRSMNFFFLVFETYLTKFINIFRYLIYLILDLIVSRNLQTTTIKSLLLIRLDSIGDYLLLRDYLRLIKSSKKYSGYKITLCGNILWKELSETFDSEFIDEFIWLNRKKFNNNPFYKYRLLKRIRQQGFESVIETTFSREILYGDSIVNTSRAKEKIGSTGSTDAYVKWKRNLLTDKFYTILIPQSSENIFEFYRNKEYFESVLNEKINFKRPLLDCSSIDIALPTDKDFAVIFPGAKDEKRRWSSHNFEIIIENLINKYNLSVIIAGSSADSNISKKMIKCNNSMACFDMTGKTTLPQLAKLISICKTLISNETGAVHFAAAVGTPFVCISNGNHFGRFNPYPKEMNILGKYVYPLEIENNLHNIDYLTKKFQFDSDLNINTIKTERVLAALDEIVKITLSKS